MVFGGLGGVLWLFFDLIESVEEELRETDTFGEKSVLRV